MAHQLKAPSALSFPAPTWLSLPQVSGDLTASNIHAGTLVHIK